MAKFFLILILICGAANANTVKQYPPYPDVWGYDLSGYPKIKGKKQIYWEHYKSDNGDYAFRFTNFFDRKNNFYEFWDVIFKKHIWLNFFEGTIKEINSMSEIGRPKNKPLELNTKVIFSNGYTLEQVSRDGKEGGIDIEISSYSLIKKDEKGNQLGEYSVILVKPTAKIVEEYDDENERYIASPNGYFYSQLGSFSCGLIGLEDDTFILYSDNLIIRFDQDFNTKFKLDANYRTRDGRILKRRLFVLPFEVIEKISSNVISKKIPTLQGFQDELINYLIENHNK